MYQRLANSDPDLLPPKNPNYSLRPLTIVMFAFLTMVFVFGIYVMANNESAFFNQITKNNNKTIDTLSTVMTTEISTESFEDITKPVPKVIASKNSTNKAKYKIPDRVVFEDKYIKITDCSEYNLANINNK